MGILVDRAIVVLMLGAAQLPYAANAQAAATGTSSALDEIIVTAQRRSENLQKTPVSIAALNPEALKQRAVLSEADLQFAVPGLNVRHTLDSNDFSFAMRGQTYEHATGSQAAVQPYFNEVPVTANAPASFYDLQSIQVLKGPQGTLFGKNVTGGAVLLTSTRPTDRLEGYVQGGIGNYAYRNLQAALNVPVSEDVLMRVAGNWENRDGFTRNLFSGRRLG
ncbi:MAG: TonB-dependent receptor, partial [Hyphomicrobiales bacterium]